MTPIFTRHDSIESGSGNAEAAGSSKSIPAMAHYFAYLTYLIFCHFCPRMAFAFHARPKEAVFLGGILHVLFMRCLKEMSRVNTGRVIARVANKHPVDQTTPCQEIGQAVCSPCAMAGYRKGAISSAITSPVPEPAVARTVNFRPETGNPWARTFQYRQANTWFAAIQSGGVFQLARKDSKLFAAFLADTGNPSTLGGHIEPHFRCVMPRAVSAAAWLFACLHYTALGRDRQ